MPFRPALVALLLAVACPASLTGLQESSLQAVLDSVRSSMAIPGASAAVILPDGTRWGGASGIAAPGIPVVASTAFEVGSVTKVYTAAAILGLVAEGRIRLEDRLIAWFPDLPGGERITVRQLLNHTHGLHDPLQEPDFVPSVLQNPTREWALEDVLNRMKDPHFEPGAQWRYSNTGFHLLGAIAETVAGSAFAEVLAARVFDPLGLDATWYGPHDPDGAMVAAAYIDPSESGAPQPVSLLMPWTAFRTSAGPAGAVVATAGDAASFLHALATGELLPGPQWDQMTDWVERPDGHRYGLGLLEIEDENRRLLGHKGNSAGYSASAFHDPASGITAVVLTNGHAVDVTPIVTALLRTAATPH
jgi:D-alanyl-D-alanine carboxypeptidase